jgi:hypothetical protein
MAVLAALCGFTHLIRGFDNRTLTRLVNDLLDGGYTGRHATYDLRRLRRKQLIERIPGSHRYLLTPLGRQVAVLFTKTHERVLAAGFATLDPHLPADLAARSPLATAWRQLQRTLNTFIANGLAAA